MGWGPCSGGSPAPNIPFVEDELSWLQTTDGKLNQGTVNFLELLQLLHPFVWRVGLFVFTGSLRLAHLGNIIQIFACLHHEFPTCIILQGLKVAQTLGAKMFFTQWPELHKAAEKSLEQDCEIASTFHEASTQAAFLSISAHQHDIEDVMQQQSTRLDVISWCTAPFSPSHTHKHTVTSVSSLHCPSSPPPFLSHSPPSLPTPNPVLAPILSDCTRATSLPITTISLAPCAPQLLVIGEESV